MSGVMVGPELSGVTTPKVALLGNTMSSSSAIMGPPINPSNMGGGPPRPWSPRQQLQYWNDFLALGSFDRLEFWSGFVTSFWAGDAVVALRLLLGGSGGGGGEEAAASSSDSCYSTHEITTIMLPHFFWTWATSGAMRRLNLEAAQATEGVLPTGVLFLASSQSTLETLLLDGSLLVRQHLKIRILFDSSGRIFQMEWSISAHDEYLLSLRAGHLVAANFPYSNGTQVCQWGFPGGVHRMLDILTVLLDLFSPPSPPVPAQSLVPSEDRNSSSPYWETLGPTKVVNWPHSHPPRKSNSSRKRRKTPPPPPTQETRPAGP